MVKVQIIERHGYHQKGFGEFVSSFAAHKLPKILFFPHPGAVKPWSERN
jgi:hypothetical protein